jgi:hypothetical protein
MKDKELTEFQKSYKSIVNNGVNPLSVTRYTGLYNNMSVFLSEKIENYKAKQLDYRQLSIINSSIRYGYKNKHKLGIYYDLTTLDDYNTLIRLLTEYYYNQTLFVSGGDNWEWRDVSDKDQKWYKSLVKFIFPYEDFIKMLTKNNGTINVKFTLFPTTIDSYSVLLNTILLTTYPEISFKKYGGYIINLLKLLNIDPSLFKYFYNNHDGNTPIDGRYPSMPEREMPGVGVLNFIDYLKETKISQNDAFTIYAKASVIEIINNLFPKVAVEFEFPKNSICGFFNVKVKSETPYNFLTITNLIKVLYINLKFDVPRNNEYEILTYDDFWINRELPIGKLVNNWTDTRRKNKSNKEESEEQE